MKFLVWVWFLSLLLSCRNRENKKAAISQEELVNIVCECGEVLVTYNIQLEKLAASDNMGALSEKMKDGDAKFNETVNCISNQVLNTIDKSIFLDIDSRIQEQCSLDLRMTNDLIRKLEESLLN